MKHLEKKIFSLLMFVFSILFSVSSIPKQKSNNVSATLVNQPYDFEYGHIDYCGCGQGGGYLYLLGWVVNGYMTVDDYILMKTPVEQYLSVYQGEESLATMGGGKGAKRFSLSLPLKADSYSVDLYVVGDNKWDPWYYEAPIYITQPTATFDKQNGLGGSDSTLVDYSCLVPNISVPTRTGYTFQGYYTGTNGTGTKYYNSDGTGAANWGEVGSQTLYAYWTVNTYNITYKDKNNAEFSGTHESGYPTQHTYDTTTTLKTATKTGYTFGGWHYNSDCSDSAVSSIGPTAISNDVALYAMWTANTYNITYKDKNDAEFSGTHESGYPTLHTYDTTTTLKTASKTGYTFGGWHYNSDCSDPAVNSIGSTAHTSDIVLYALWTINSYTVTFNANGHGTAPNSQTVDYNGLATNPGTITAPGFTFNGWYKEVECTNKWNFTTDTITENTTIYAKWSEDTDYKPVLVNSIGGYFNDKGTTKQIIGFGFQVSSDVYNSLVNDSDFGIIAYKAGSAQVEYSKGKVSALKTNEGRFYIYLISEEAQATTYYAKAFVKFDGTYIYSELVNESGNFDTEYKL